LDWKEESLKKETIDFVLALVQIASLIALVVYVVKTWHIASATKKAAEASEKSLQEMKEMRDQETAPYVIVYFEIASGTPFIYLVVKNTGRTIAKDIKMRFKPPLRTSSNNLEMEDMPMIKDGITSLAPRQELRTFFDSAISYYGREDLPLRITAKVSYSGGLQNSERTYEQTLDLQSFKGLLYTDEKDMNDLVKQVEKVANGSTKSHSDLQQIAHILRKGMGLDKQSQKKYGWRPKQSKRV
jgi:hypothetical protein